MTTADAPRASTAFKLSGQVALITGAAHGQGRAAALALAREGVRIAALDVARPLAYPGYAMGSTADVRDDLAVSAAVASTIETFGRVDILFNNAGICGYGLAHELTEDAWDSM